MKVLLEMSSAMNLPAHELIHFLITTLVAIFLWWRYRDRRLILVAFLVGIFTDLDHLFDYFLYFGFKFNLSEFLNVVTYMKPANKIYILFHGWEFIIPLWLLGKGIGRKLKINGLEWAISLSYLGHLLWDNFAVSAPFWAYSFIYRLINGFSLGGFDGN